MKTLTLREGAGTDFGGTRFIGPGYDVISNGENSRTLSKCRQLIVRFMEFGRITLSPKSAWIILEYCNAKRISFHQEETNDGSSITISRINHADQ